MAKIKTATFDMGQKKGYNHLKNDPILIGEMLVKVLIVVDMQNDFIDGTLGTKDAQEIVGRVAEKISDFDGNVIVTLDTHQANYLNTQEGKLLPVEHCIKGTHGWGLNDVVRSAINKKSLYKTFEKPTFGSVNLAKYLVDINERESIEAITLIGLCTDICVISNALLIKAHLPEIPIAVDASCCAGVTPDSHNNALAAMKMCQITIENE